MADSISLDEAVMPKWFRDKTYNFPFLSCLFTIGLLVFGFFVLSSIHNAGYHQGYTHAIQERWSNTQEQK